MRAETAATVRAAIDRLPDPQRTVVLLRMRDAMTFSAIADKLDIPLSTALTRMQAALDKLREYLK